MTTVSGDDWIWSDIHNEYYKISSYDDYGKPIYVSYRQLAAQPTTQQSAVESTTPQAYYQQSTQLPVQQTSYYQPASQPTAQAANYLQPNLQRQVSDPNAQDNARQWQQQYQQYQQPQQQAQQLQQQHEQQQQLQQQQHQQQTLSLPHMHASMTRRLNDSYQVRNARFFRVGQVFAMLYTEPAGSTSNIDENDDTFTTVKYGEKAHSSIRRFIVVKREHGFVYACAISTYSDRATSKQGCVPSEHAVVYFTGTNPESCYVQDEKKNGLDKDPIEITPKNRSEKPMKATSRIRFSKLYTIDMNVKVKDIGAVVSNDTSKVIKYCREYPIF